MKIPGIECSLTRWLALVGQAVELLPPQAPIMQRRADQGGRCTGRSHGDELFDCRDSLHRRSSPLYADLRGDDDLYKPGDVDLTDIRGGSEPERARNST